MLDDVDYESLFKNELIKELNKNSLVEPAFMDQGRYCVCENQMGTLKLYCNRIKDLDYDVVNLKTGKCWACGIEAPPEVLTQAKLIGAL